MNIQQDFTVKTLVELHSQEFFDTLMDEGRLKAYELLDSKWTLYAMTAMARSVAIFHGFDLNNSQIRDVVEVVIAELNDLIYEWTQQYEVV